MPWALSIGVPYEMFGKMNPAKLRPFELAYERRIKYDDDLAHRYGLYFLRAAQSAWSGKNVYPKEPFMKDYEMKPSEHDYFADAAKFREYANAYNKVRRERGD